MTDRPTPSFVIFHGRKKRFFWYDRLSGGSESDCGMYAVEDARYDKLECVLEEV